MDLNQLSQRTEGFSGADIDNLCKEAVLHAMTKIGLDLVESVSQSDFDHVLQTFQPSLQTDDCQQQSTNIF